MQEGVPLSVSTAVRPQVEALQRFRQALHAIGWDDLISEQGASEVCIRVRRLPPAVSASDCDWVVICGPDEPAARENVLKQIAGLQASVT